MFRPTFRVTPHVKSENKRFWQQKSSVMMHGPIHMWHALSPLVALSIPSHFFRFWVNRIIDCRASYALRCCTSAPPRGHKPRDAAGAGAMDPDAARSTSIRSTYQSVCAFWSVQTVARLVAALVEAWSCRRRAYWAAAASYYYSGSRGRHCARTGRTGQARAPTDGSMEKRTAKGWKIFLATLGS
jgi:hypothetical protein